MTLRQRIYNLLLERSPMRTRHLADALCVSTAQVNNATGRMCKQGHLVKSGAGYYTQYAAVVGRDLSDKRGQPFASRAALARFQKQPQLRVAKPEFARTWKPSPCTLADVWRSHAFPSVDPQSSAFDNLRAPSRPEKTPSRSNSGGFLHSEAD